MPPDRSSPLDSLRARVRRLQLVLGIGFLAMMLGSVLSAALQMRLLPRLDAVQAGWVSVAVRLALPQLWLLLALPACSYAAGLLAPVHRWRFPFAAAVVGELFLWALALIARGTAAFTRHPLSFAAEALALVLGVALSARAVTAAHRKVRFRDEAAATRARATAGEYEAFRKEAERLAEAAPARPPDSAPGS